MMRISARKRREGKIEEAEGEIGTYFLITYIPMPTYWTWPQMLS